MIGAIWFLEEMIFQTCNYFVNHVRPRHVRRSIAPHGAWVCLYILNVHIKLRYMMLTGAFQDVWSP